MKNVYTLMYDDDCDNPQEERATMQQHILGPEILAAVADFERWLKEKREALEREEDRLLEGDTGTADQISDVIQQRRAISDAIDIYQVTMREYLELLF